MNVYDFDNTIYSGDSSIDFYFYCLRKYPAVITCLPRQIKAALDYKLGRIEKVIFKEVFFSFLNKLHDPKKDVGEFWDKNQSKMTSWYLRQQEEDDLIVSASPVFLLRDLCTRLNIKYLIASEVNIRTGRFESDNCYGKEKVKRVMESFPDAKINKFYSDSLSDKYLAELSKEAFMVAENTISQWPVDNNGGQKK